MSNQVSRSLLSCVAATDPGITVYLADSSTIQLPRPGWSWSESRGRGEIASLGEGRFFAAYHAGVPTFSMLDRETCTGVYWAGRTPLPHFEVSSPLLHIIHWWLADNSAQVVHAAAIANDAGAAMMIGAGGSGKSTTALACALAGFAYIADDYCAVTSCGAGIFEVRSVFASAKMLHSDVARFPELEPRLRSDSPEGEKIVLDMRDVTSRSASPVRCILLPTVTRGEKSRLQMATKADAMLALAPSTLFQLTNARAAAFASMRDLVRTVPAYRLILGDDFENIPALVATALDA